jgi:integrase
LSDHDPRAGADQRGASSAVSFASHLIRAGIDPVRASRQLGHTRPSITLDIYAHEFDHARGLDDVRDWIDAAFGARQI